MTGFDLSHPSMRSVVTAATMDRRLTRATGNSLSKAQNFPRGKEKFSKIPGPFGKILYSAHRSVRHSSGAYAEFLTGGANPAPGRGVSSIVWGSIYSPAPENFGILLPGLLHFGAFYALLNEI